jgi:hypothetical protein
VRTTVTLGVALALAGRGGDPTATRAACIVPSPDIPDPPMPARPPVRMLAVGASLGAPLFHSICHDDYTATVAAIAQP